MAKTRKNYIFVLLYNILNVIAPILTAPYLSRKLGVEGIGIFSFYSSIAYYFTLFAKMGLTNYGTREIAKCKDNKEQKSLKFYSIFYMQLMFGSFILLAYLFCVLLFYNKFKGIGFIFAIWIFSNIFNIDWYLFGIEKFKETSIYNIFIKVIEVLCIFLFIKTSEDVWKYCLIVVTGYLFTYLLFLITGLKTTKFKKVDLNLIFSNFKPCLILMIPIFALNIYRSMDKVMLGQMTNIIQCGYYEAAEKIIFTLTMFISSFGQIMLPKMSNLVDKGSKLNIKKTLSESFAFITFLSCAMCFGINGIAKSLVPIFFGKEFVNSIVLIYILSASVIFIGWGNVIRTQYLIPKKYDNIYIKSTIYGAIINLAFNLILIPKYNAIGACISTLLAELYVPLYQAYKVKEEINFFDYIKRNLIFMVIGIFMMIILIILGMIINNIILRIMLQIVLGFIFYLSISIIEFKKRTDRL